MATSAWPALHKRCGNTQHLPQSAARQSSQPHCAVDSHVPFFTLTWHLAVFPTNAMLPSIVCYSILYLSIQGKGEAMTVNKGMMLLAALASNEFYDNQNRPPQLPDPAIRVLVPGDGLCLWYCLYLACKATPQELFAWHLRARSAGGIPSPEEYKWEENNVLLWALDLGRVTGCPMPREHEAAFLPNIPQNMRILTLVWE